MKGKTIGYIKGVQNVGYCKAEADVKVGMGIILDRAAKTAKIPSSEDEAKACHRVVSNINVNAKMHDFKDTLTIKKGDYVRADDLLSVENLEMEFADYEIESADYAGLTKGDKLVFKENTGLLTKSEKPGGYAVYFEVIEKTAYMGKGVLVIVRKGTPAASEAV